MVSGSKMASVSFSVQDKVASRLDKFIKKNGIGSRTLGIKKLLDEVESH